MKQQHKTKLIQTEHDSIEILVGYDETVKHYSFIAEGHGYHTINEDDVEIKLTSVEIVIGGTGKDILPILSDPLREVIINALND